MSYNHKYVRNIYIKDSHYKIPMCKNKKYEDIFYL